MDRAHLIIYLDGAGMLVIAAIAAYMAVRTRGRSSAMRSAGTVTAARAAASASPAGPTVELVGNAVAAEPLTSPVRGLQCVYFRQKIEQLYVHSHDDMHGSVYTSREWRTVSDESAYVPFTLADSSGGIRVVMAGADVTARESAGDSPASPDEPFGAHMGGSMEAIGQVARMFSDNTGQRRQSEWVIDNGARVYVLGPAFADADGPVVKQGEGPFLVSVKSEEDLARSHAWKFAAWVAGAVAAAALAGGFIYYGAVTRTLHSTSTKSLTWEYVIGGIVLSALIGLGYRMYKSRPGSMSLGNPREARMPPPPGSAMDASAGLWSPGGVAPLGVPAAAGAGFGRPGVGEIMCPSCERPIAETVDTCPFCHWHLRAVGFHPQAESAGPAAGGPAAAWIEEPGAAGPGGETPAGDMPGITAPQDAPGTAPPQPSQGARIAVIQRDVMVGDRLAFKAGERVEVESESPDSDRPEYRYVVMSKSLNQKFRLSDMEVFL